MKKLKFMILFIAFFLFINIVNAECDYKTQLEINNAASNVKANIDYKYKIIGADGLEHPEVPEDVIYDLESGYVKSMFVYINITNISDNIYLRIINEDEDINELIYASDLIDGQYQHQVPDTNIIRTYNIKIYSNISDCSDEEIKSIEIKTPMYNYLSGTRVCENNNAYYCMEFITTPIELNTWELLQKQKDDEIAENTEIENANKISIYLILAFVIVIIILILTIIIILKKRNQEDIMRQSL